MTESPETRASLILRLRSNDDLVAWNEFVQVYEPLIMRIAQKKGFQYADSAEIAQEVLVRVARSVENWDPDPNRGSFRGWLFRVTRNLMVEFIRTRKRLPITSGDSTIAALINDLPASGPESVEFDIESERQTFRWAAEKIRSDFEANTWSAFWLTAVENKPIAMVADELKMTTGAIYVARSRVMKRLREVIARSEFISSEKGNEHEE